MRRLGLTAFTSFVLLICVNFDAQSVALAQESAVPPAEQTETSIDVQPKSLKQKASFLMGFQFVQNLKRQGMELDMDQLINGMKHAFADKPVGMDLEEITAVQTAFNREINKKRVALLEKLAGENKALGEAFLIENAKQENVRVLDNGVQYTVITPGTGDSPTPADTVKVHYRGLHLNGNQFTASASEKPAELAVGTQIPGFVAVIQKMKVGAKWKVVIPSRLAFGIKGTRAVGPNETLIYELQLIEILKKEK